MRPLSHPGTPAFEALHSPRSVLNTAPVFTSFSLSRQPETPDMKAVAVAITKWGALVAVAAGIAADRAAEAAVALHLNGETFGVVIGALTFAGSVIPAIFIAGRRFQRWANTASENAAHVQSLRRKLREQTEKVARLERALIASGVIDHDGNPTEDSG